MSLTINHFLDLDLAAGTAVLLGTIVLDGELAAVARFSREGEAPAFLAYLPEHVMNATGEIAREVTVAEAPFLRFRSIREHATV